VLNKPSVVFDESPMSTRHILTITAAALLAAPFLNAQAPAPGAPAVPATPATPATPGATATPPAAGATDPAKKARPLSPTEQRSLTQVFDAMQFHMRMGTIAKGKNKDDKDLIAFGTRVNKEMTDQWTPLVTIATARGMDNKNIPIDISKQDKSDIDKLGKAKDDKWRVEYYELFAKQAKRNARTVDTAAKSFTDPELKQFGTALSKTFNDQAESLESTYKGLKNTKKDAK
jgi:hypothetical protein